MSVVALVTDLLFVTKIRSTAQAVGVPVRMVRSTADLLDGAGEARLALIDLNASWVDPVEAIRQLRAMPHPPRILGYLSHVQRELAEAAQAAGADEVMPRSRFSGEL